MADKISKLVTGHTDFTREFVDFFTNGGFGNVLKSDIETVVFDCLYKHSKLVPHDKRNNYALLNRADIAHISSELRIPERKVRALLEKAHLRQGIPLNEEKLRKLLVDCIESTSVDLDLFQRGRCRLYIPNIVLRQQIETKIAIAKGTPDHSFNKDILTLTVHDLFMITGADKDQKAINAFLDHVKGTNEQLKENKELQRIEKSIGKKGFSAFFKDFCTQVGASVTASVIAKGLALALAAV